MRIITQDVYRHDWRNDLAVCKHCGVSKEQVIRFGPIRCSARVSA